MKKHGNKKNVTKPIIIIGFIMALFTAGAIYHMLGTYDGLGMKQVVESHEYQMTKIVSTDERLFYDDGRYISLTGIDVSVFQNQIDWKAVKADGVDFVMIRLGFRGYGDGKLYLDDCFEDNLKGAKEVGLDIGVYFFSQAVTPEEAIEEARFVVRHIRGKGITFPVAFDMEPIDGTERTADLTKKQKTEVADAFCQVVKRNGYTPLIYGNLQWLGKHIDLSYLTKYDTWLAHYANMTFYDKKFLMWQYADNGNVAGIEGPVDMNIYFVERD